GGRGANILGGRVRLQGVLRSLDEAARLRAHESIRRLAAGAAAAHGAEARVEIATGSVSVVNDPDVAARALALAADVLGADAGGEAAPITSREDFGDGLAAGPGCFGYLGVRNPEVGAVHPVHTPEYRMDEAALSTGTRLLCVFASALGDP